MATFQELLEKDQRVFPKVGEIVEGTVISFSKAESHLDIDGITTGVVRGPELYDESGEFSDLQPGERVQATVLELENENGEMELSFREAGHRKAWGQLDTMLRTGEIVEAKIVDANKGGLLVRVGRVNGFLPVSQLIPEHYPRVEGGDRNKILERLQGYVGKSFNVKVIDIQEEENKLIVSEKAAWEEQKRESLSKYNVGDVLEGTVTGVVNFGAFVEFGDGFEGLVHISEMAWQRIEDPRDFVKVGDKTKVQIIQMEGSKISLSMKRFLEDPWKKAAERYTVGQVVKGTVLKLNPFGAFVELDSQIHGLAHISELSKKMVKDPSDVVKVGDTAEFKIISIEPNEHRLGLSIKALYEKPEETKEASEDTETKDEKNSDADASETTEQEIAEQPTLPIPESTDSNAGAAPAPEVPPLSDLPDTTESVDTPVEKETATS